MDRAGPPKPPVVSRGLQDAERVWGGWLISPQTLHRLAAQDYCGGVAPGIVGTAIPFGIAGIFGIAIPPGGIPFCW